jgi:hypothetical protein
MACFYCSKCSVSSSDVGHCEETCNKLVCTRGVSSRPHDYHADHCDCGCASLVCVYEMKSHAKKVHKSTVEQCFPSSSTHVALGAGAAIEDSATIDVDGNTEEAREIRRAIVRFVEFNDLFIADMPLPMDVHGRRHGELEFKVTAQHWPQIAAAAVPRIMQNIGKSWDRARDEIKDEVSAEVRQRIERLVAFQQADLGFLKRFPQNVIDVWFDLSPRLTYLFVQHAPDKLRSPVLGVPPSHLPASAPADWRSMPQHLTSPAHKQLSMHNMTSP